MTLLLLPNLLGEHPHPELFLPASVERAVQTIDGLIAESVKGGRRYLSHFSLKVKPDDVPLALLNTNTPDGELDFLLEPLVKGEKWGLVTDCGLPCIADPGAKLVARARERGIQLRAFVGPSSLTLALMLSGLPSQRFAFHGYLDKNQLEKEIKRLESRSQKEGETDLFIEAPHRNQLLFDTLLTTLAPTTQLCIAQNLTLPDQRVITYPIATWRTFPTPNLHKSPTLFLIRA